MGSVALSSGSSCVIARDDVLVGVVVVDGDSREVAAIDHIAFEVVGHAVEIRADPIIRGTLTSQTLSPCWPSKVVPVRSVPMRFPASTLPAPHALDADAPAIA